MMKKCYAGICMFLLALALFCGAAAAVSFTSEAVVTPSGDLKISEKVLVSMTFEVKAKELTNLSFSTPLEKAAWDISVYNGKSRLLYYTPTGDSFAFSSCPVNEDLTVSVRVSLEGTVPLRLSGYSVSMFEITDKNGAGYATPVQNIQGRVLVTTAVPTPAASQTAASEPVLRISCDKNAFSVTPEELYVGKYVTGEMTVKVPKKLSAEITLASPLENVHFSAVQSCSDGRQLAYLKANGSPFTIPASTVYIDEAYSIKITFTGTVPENLDGAEVSLLSIDAGEHGSFVSPVQQIGEKQPVALPTFTPIAVETPVATEIPTVEVTAAPAAQQPEPKDMDLIAMLVNWIKSLFGQGA
ncbi:MAG TPA: hypothetical protein O0X70_03820 [Methanocorpusculum sp.]|nr:hypothetical protein [Methanocorpusculum sp.]